ncbi:MAG TPA: single-stranded-DNA-specific exonuclease RecJ [Paenibacillus sp.]
MLQSKYHWNLSPCDLEVSRQLQQQLGIPAMLASLLVTRRITNPEDVSNFLDHSLTGLHDPYQMSGIEEAVPRIRKAIEAGERILIYGDYDADGVSSTALMIELMRTLQANFEFYIPHRSKEGYGLHNHVLKQAHDNGVSLIITVDTGISAVEQIAYAAELGIDVIVTDHHEPPAKLPEAYTLINPKLPYCSYPFKGLAGVGVAYKLASALLGEDTPAAWLELVALGTIADLMPLMDENRVLVRMGLEQMTASSFPGISALLHTAGWKEGEVTSTNVAFGLAPRINAAGRMNHAFNALNVLTATSMEVAEDAAEKLDLLNRERQQLVDDIVGEAFERIEAAEAVGTLPDVLVVAGEGWNVGVVGIVASKILERYYRPTLVLGINAVTGECKGSARSIPGFDIYEALTHCDALLDHYGGHPSAAGMSLHRDRLEEFEQKLNEFAQNVLRPEHFIPSLQADLECRLREITLPVIEQLSRMAPFGMENPSPRLLVRDAELLDYRQMGKDGKHLKLTIRQDGSMIEAVAFGKGEVFKLLTPEARVDLVVEAAINEWNGQRKPQLFIQDISISHLQVFDYRDALDPGKKIEELQKSLLTTSYCGSGTMAVVSSRRADLLSVGHLEGTSVWVYDQEQGISPGRSESDAGDEVTVKTLFVMELPESPEIWNNMLSSFGNLERVFLLHPRSSMDLLEAPSRDRFKQVYIFLRKYVGLGECDEERVIAEVMTRFGISRRMLYFILDIFVELDFIVRNEGQIEVNPAPSKRPLESARGYQALGLLAEMEQILLYEEVPQITEWITCQLQGVS